MFNNLSIKSKVILGCVTPVALIICLGALCLFSLNALDYKAQKLEKANQTVEDAINLVGAAVDMETGVRGFLLAGKDEFLDSYHGGKKRFGEIIIKLKKSTNDRNLINQLDVIDSTIADWQTNVTDKAVVKRRQVGKTMTMDDIAHLVGQAHGKKYFDKFRSEVTSFIEQNRETMSSMKQESQQTKHKTFVFIVSFICGAVALSILVSLLLTRAISRIKQASNIADEISTGNLEIAVDRKGNNDEISKLLDSMMLMVGSLKDKAQVANKIALGDLNTEVNLLSDKDELGKSFKEMIGALN